MDIKQEKVYVRDLALGMYVSKLDRPWVETPFPIQGFHIRSQEDINTLELLCKYVYVDFVRSTVPKKMQPSAPATRTHRPKAKPITVHHGVYEPATPLKKELSVASNLHEEVSNAVAQVMESLSAGKPLLLPETQRVATRMVDSITRNPDAFVWVSRIKEKDIHTYAHSVRASIWAIAFGRHLGLKKDILETLATGVLLSEVGKTKLSGELLNKGGRLTPEEFEQFKKHIDHGVAILKNTRGIPHDVVSIAGTYHERHDGSGYPLGLQADEIPLLGKIAGIVDYYVSIMHPRPGRKPLTSSQAMDHLFTLRDKAFQADVVEEFIQAIGIYPTGTLVELSTGEVGVITEQNRKRRLRPRLMLILDKDKKPLARHQAIDLMEYTKDSNGHPVDIAKSLSDGSYGIDARAFDHGTLSRLWQRGKSLIGG